MQCMCDGAMCSCLRQWSFTCRARQDAEARNRKGQHAFLHPASEQHYGRLATAVMQVVQIHGASAVYCAHHASAEC